MSHSCYDEDEAPPPMMGNIGYITERDDADKGDFLFTLLAREAIMARHRRIFMKTSRLWNDTAKRQWA